MRTDTPFEFGRELSGSELVDREDELAMVVRTMQEGGRLFLIGPRRYGKTSILRAATETAEAGCTVAAIIQTSINHPKKVFISVVSVLQIRIDL